MRQGNLAIDFDWPDTPIYRMAEWSIRPWHRNCGGGHWQT